jgi:urease accessory protein
MLIVRRTCASVAAPDAVLELSFDRRQQARQRTSVTSGEEIGLFLERGTVLHDGDCLLAEDGRTVRVVAASEALVEVHARDGQALARAAYHLGNRHASVEIASHVLRFPADPVLKQLMHALGFEVREIHAAFEAEPGAYSAGAHAHAGNARHAGVIHDFATRGAQHGK